MQESPCFSRGENVNSLHGEIDRIYVDGGVNYTIILDGKVQKVALDALTRRFETA